MVLPRVRKPIVNIQERPKWTYKDRFPANKILNPILPFEYDIPHFVLKDKSGKTRYTLAYRKIENRIYISAIQRERTQYTIRKGETFWDSEKETEASKELQRELGIHPSEYILIEFLKRFSDEIKKGTTILLKIDKKEINSRTYFLYKALIERFFKRKPIRKNAEIEIYALSLEKERVKKALGIL